MSRPSINRKQPRLKDYDYSLPGAYFATICTRSRIHYFEESECERICREVWEDMVNHHPVYLDEFVIMPDHVHFIIWICGKPELGGDFQTGDAGVAPTIPGSSTSNRRVEACLDRKYNGLSDSLISIVGSFKSAVSRRIHAELKIGFAWQRGFYDHVIRNEEDLFKVRGYIQDNPKMVVDFDEFINLKYTGGNNAERI